MGFVLPATIFVEFPEYPYDAFGEEAPGRWRCACGSAMALDFFDDEREVYVAVSDERKQEFIAQHTACKVTCFHCHRTPVERPGYWCEPCEAL